MADVAERLAGTWGAYIEALRSNEGFQDELYDALVDSLRACAREWRHARCIPRLGVNVLVDIVPVSQAAAHAYDEPVRQRVMDASFVLYDLVIDCVGVEPG